MTINFDRSFTEKSRFAAKKLGIARQSTKQSFALNGKHQSIEEQKEERRLLAIDRAKEKVKLDL